MASFLLIIGLLLIHCVICRAKLRLLVEGWTRVAHSFGIVNCFQIIGLMKQFEDIQLYVTETTYYYHHWEAGNYSIFDDEYRAALNSLTIWNGQDIDAIYRIHFPFDLRPLEFSPVPYPNVPIIIFYVATRSVFTYAELIAPNEFMEEHLDHVWNRDKGVAALKTVPPHVYFVTPSPGSAHALRCLMDNAHFERNHRVIPHGVDTSLFYNQRDPSKRAWIRRLFGVGPRDLMFLHVGAMVAAKGLDMMIIVALWLQKNTDRVGGNFMLVLKGLHDVYDSTRLLELKLSSLVDDNVILQEDLDALIRDHIRFTSATLSFSDLNDLYNAADAYWSPYAYEGFNLPVLEAIATGLPIIVSRNGSTSFFIDDILSHVAGAQERIFFIPAEAYNFHTSMWFGVRSEYMFNVVVENLDKFRVPPPKSYLHSLQAFLEENYSWTAVAVQLRKMIEEVIGNKDFIEP